MKPVSHYVVGFAAAAGFALTAAIPNAVLAQWEPERPIEFVIQTPPGGGSDIYTRLWLGIIDEKNLSPVPVTPVNMPGGAGAVALTYLYQQDGDPHYLTPTLNSIVTTPLQQTIPVMYPSQDLTPVAQMVTDPFLLWTNPEMHANWDEFEKACKEKRMTVFGTGARQEDEVQVNVLQRATDCKEFRYVPQAGGGDVASKIAGKHGDFSVNQPAEGMPHYPDNMHPILIFAKERHPTFPDVPTHWEEEVGTQGDGENAKLLSLETGLHQVRGLVGPPNMPQEAKDWYENLFRQVFESDRWQDFLEKNGMVPTFRGPDEYQKFMVQLEDNYVEMIRDLGWPLRDDLVEQSER